MLRVILFTLFLNATLLSADIVFADNCGSPADCQETSNYNAVISVAGGAIAIVAVVFGSALGGAIAGHLNTPASQEGGDTAKTGPWRLKGFSFVPTETKKFRFLLPPGVDAVTLWPWIIYRHEPREDIPLRYHAHYHWRQAQRWLVIPWYMAYLLLKPFYLGKRVEQHPLETSAYAIERKIRAKLHAGQNVGEYPSELNNP